MAVTWRPKTGGILSIIAGIVGLIGSPIMIAFGTVRTLDGLLSTGDGWWGYYLLQVGFLFIVIGIIAVVGGIFALIRKKWWIALTGSICAIICFFFLGIPATIFLAQSKRDFR